MAKPKPKPALYHAEKKGWKTDDQRGKSSALNPESHTKYRKALGKVTDQMGPAPKVPTPPPKTKNMCT